MAVDIRATVACSLGTVISGNIADDYIQGNGLVLVRGSVEISGLITPAVGTAVTFTYKINGGRRNIPRKLRVLSSFADPFRRTTTVQLGCKLTYLSDLREKLRWDAFDDPQNQIDYDPADYEVIPIPVNASSMMDRCLTELGITASTNPLTNRFSGGQYDFSGGWVNVLGELLVSEGYCGYLDRDEVLQVFALNQDGGTGPILTTNDIIDIAAINSGQLPGEAVVVSYSALRFQGDPNAQNINTWQQTKSSNKTEVTITYTNPTTKQQDTVTYPVLETIEETTVLEPLSKASTRERVNVVKYRETKRTESSEKAVPNLIVQFLEAGLIPPSAQLTTITKEWYYYNSEAVEVRSIKETYADLSYAYGQASLPMVFGSGNTKSFVYLPINQTYLQQAIETDTIVQNSFRKVFTRKFGNWLATIAGQQSIAESRESFTTPLQVATYMYNSTGGKYLIASDIYTEVNTSSGQQAPFGSAALTDQYNRDDSRQQSESELVLALGSATAQRRIEFTLPMAPDDAFVTDNGQYVVIPNNANEKATAYGLIQNRLLLGNRNGMNIRTNALQMPEAPFSPLTVRIGDVAALYRTNATSWTFSSEGLVVSTDALFWGAVGGSGPRWFPVAPGVTTLPSLPSTSTVDVTGTDDNDQTVTIGTKTVITTDGVVAPYNETRKLAPKVRVRLVVKSLPYGLTASTAVVLTTRAKCVAHRVRIVNIPAADIGLAAATPSISTGKRLTVPAGTVSVAPVAPIISISGIVQVPAAVIAVEGVAPDLVGRQRTSVNIPAADISVAAVAPQIITGTAVFVPAATIAVDAQVPSLETGGWINSRYSYVQWIYPDNWVDD